MAELINTAELLETAQLPRNTSDWVYNGLDCCVTFEIAEALAAQLDNVASATSAYSHSLQAPVLEMSMRGILVDQARRYEVLKEFRGQINQLDDQLTSIVREGIGFTNALPRAGKPKEARWWRSPASLKNLFYDVMHLPVQRQRSVQRGTYEPSVNRVSLEKLGEYLMAEPLVLHLLLLRDIDKKRQWLETGIDPDGRMRTSYNIAGTNTGRLSSSDSDWGTGGNMQNVDRSLRSVFIADQGMKFCNIDLEQGDARNVGAICWNLFVEKYGEEYAGSYLNACESGDLHTYNSRLIWPAKAWTGDLRADKALAEELFYRQDSFRQMSKKGGHGTNYYGTPRTMAKHLHVPISMMEDFQLRYFRAYPVIGSFDRTDRKAPTWHNYVKNELISSRQIITLLGRRRYFHGRPEDDTTIREAIAYEPQSLTADEIDTALLNLFRSNRVQLLAQVHDSLLFQFPEELEDEIVPWAVALARKKIILEKGREFVVPTEAKVGWNWGDQSADNPDGLVKFKGHDTRKRERQPWLKRFSIFDL